MADRNTVIRGNQIKDATITADELNATVAGAGITGGAGSALAVNVDNASMEVDTDVVQVKDAGITAAKLAAAVAGNGLAGGAGTALSVNVDGSSIEIDTDTLRVKAAGITNAMLDGSISDDKMDADYIQTSEVDGATIEFSGGSLNVKANGINATQIDLTATYDFSPSGTVKVGTPSAGTDAANKAYVDSVAQGLDVKASVRVATIAAGTLVSSFENGDSVDGVVLATGDRILIKNQAVGSENGVYVVNASGAPTRAVDYAAAAAVASTFMFVEEGDTLKDNGYVCTNDVGSDVVATDALVYEQFSGAGQVIAGDGLSKDGNTLDVNVDDSSIEIDTDTLRVKAAGVTDAMLFVDYVKVGEVDEVTLDSAAGTLLRVKALGVDTAQLANDAVDKTKIAADIAGLGLVQAAGGELDVQVDGASIEVNVDTLRVKALGITNAMLAGSIADSKLSQITTANKVDGSALVASSVVDGALAVDYVRVSEVDEATIDSAGGTLLRIKDLGVSNAKIANDTVLEPKLSVTNAPTDGYVLSYNAAGTNFTWISGTADSIKESDLVKSTVNAVGAETVLPTFSGSAAVLANSVQVYLNGLIQEEGAGNDYTIVLATGVVTFLTPLEATDIVIMNGVLDN